MEKFAKFMSAQHKEMDILYKKYLEEKPKDIKKARHFFSEFKALLEKHMRSEDEVLFPFIEKVMGDETVNVILKHEHEQIEKLVNDIKERLERDGTQTENLEKSLKWILDWHALKEEGTVYRLIDQISEKEKEKKIGP